MHCVNICFFFSFCYAKHESIILPAISLPVFVSMITSKIQTKSPLFTFITSLHFAALTSQKVFKNEGTRGPVFTAIKWVKGKKISNA